MSFLGAFAGPALGGLFSYLGSRQEAKATRDAAQPLPTYFRHTQTGPEKEMWGEAWPMMQRLFSGGGPTPTKGWWEGLDEDIRAGITEPYEQEMESIWEQLAGRGVAGSPRAGASGAGADVIGEYMSKAAPRMARTGWEMMMPGMVMPYQAAMGMLPEAMGSMLIGHTPTIAEVGEAPAFSELADLQQEFQTLQEQQAAGAPQAQLPWGHLAP